MTKYRAATTFSDDEVKILHFVLATILRGGDPKTIRTNRAFPNLCRKVIDMNRKVDIANAGGDPLTEKEV